MEHKSSTERYIQTVTGTLCQLCYYSAQKRARFKKPSKRCRTGSISNQCIYLLSNSLNQNQCDNSCKRYPNRWSGCNGTTIYLFIILFYVSFMNQITSGFMTGMYRTNHSIMETTERNLHRIVIDGMGLSTIPVAVMMANISNSEYQEKYNLYLTRIRKRMEAEGLMDPKRLYTFPNSGGHGNRRQIGSNQLLEFNLTGTVPITVEEGTLRVMVRPWGSKSVQGQVDVYHISRLSGRRFLERRIVDGNRRWLEFDVTDTISDRPINKNLKYEIHINRGWELIEPDRSDLQPTLNIIGRQVGRRKRARPIQRRTDCTKTNQKCCRHQMDVIFKEIKGFEFIIQPKNFDAGYCRGKCPPRYNPAHHHAVLQSLIWKQDRQKAPRPCCAPSKLIALEVLHVDENDSSKLKVSTWTDMRVLECACS